MPTTLPIPTKYSLKDLIEAGAGATTFSGESASDVGADAFYLPNEVAYFASTPLTANDQADGLGNNVALEFTDENEFLTKIWGETVYDRVKVTDPTYQTGTVYFFGAVAGSPGLNDDINRLQSQITSLASGAQIRAVGDRFPSNREPSYYATRGAIPDTFDEYSQSVYAEAYAIIGDRYEQMHVDFGKGASSAGSFYPTPPPGFYSRSAIPPVEFTDAEVSVASDYIDIIGTIPSAAANLLRDGTALRFEVLSGTAPAPLADGTTYYGLFSNGTGSDSRVFLYTTEADAIANTSIINLTTAGSGSFRLVQDGLGLDHALDDHEHEILVDNNSAATGDVGVEGSGSAGDAQASGDGVQEVKTASTNVSNESRPKTAYIYWYTQIEAAFSDPNVITPSAFFYDSGQLDVTTIGGSWNAASYEFTHGLSANPDELLWAITFYETATDAYSSGGIPTISTASSYGWTFRPGTDNNSAKLVTSTNGMVVLDSSGVVRALTGADAGYVRIIALKPNIVGAVAPADPLAGVVKYSTGWTLQADVTDLTWSIAHGLGTNLADLIPVVALSSDGTDANAEIVNNITWRNTTAASQTYGIVFNATDENTVELQTGAGGIFGLDNTGALVGYGANVYLKVTFYKAQVLTTIDPVQASNPVDISTSSQVSDPIPLAADSAGVVIRRECFNGNGTTNSFTLSMTDSETITVRGNEAKTAAQLALYGDGYIEIRCDGTNWYLSDYEMTYVDVGGVQYEAGTQGQAKASFRSTKNNGSTALQDFIFSLPFATGTSATIGPRGSSSSQPLIGGDFGGIDLDRIKVEVRDMGTGGLLATNRSFTALVTGTLW